MLSGVEHAEMTRATVFSVFCAGFCSLTSRLEGTRKLKSISFLFIAVILKRSEESQNVLLRACKGLWKVSKRNFRVTWQPPFCDIQCSFDSEFKLRVVFAVKQHATNPLL